MAEHISKPLVCTLAWVLVSRCCVAVAGNAAC